LNIKQEDLINGGYKISCLDIIIFRNGHDKIEFLIKTALISCTDMLLNWNAIKHLVNCYETFVTSILHFMYVNFFSVNLDFVA
jgi:hypothetical protein